MDNEPAGNQSEDRVRHCGCTTGIARTGHRACDQCGPRQETVTGRLSVRDPEPDDLKFLSQAFVRKYGEYDWTYVGPVEDPLIAYDYSEAEQALLDAIRSLDLSGDDERGDEVS
jgi:hypothetical protein